MDIIKTIEQNIKDIIKKEYPFIPSELVQISSSRSKDYDLTTNIALIISNWKENGKLKTE